MTATPTVSFIVPCYNLAHFLSECVRSILRQFYDSIEIIIIDDHSPDNTREVANSIISSMPNHRVTYVFNEHNLGNIRTYNLGIGLAAGKYVWILSPDDRLRSPDIVTRYVRLMESDDQIGLVFCPAHLIDNTCDTGVYAFSRYPGNQLVYRESEGSEAVLDGMQFAKDIIDGKFELVAPSVLIRKICYENITLFPEDLPHRGDTYVWALIATRWKVGYLAEAMVDYRIHHGSMTVSMSLNKDAIEDDIAVLWRIKAEAKRRDIPQLADHCLKAVIRCYAIALVMTNRRGYFCRLTYKAFCASLLKFEADRSMRARIKIRVLVAIMQSVPGRARKVWRIVWPNEVSLQLKQITSASRTRGGAAK